jgi:hypothetical protein
VDNDIIKSIITKKFSVVPAIVVMIEDEISLYTGENVFEWFNIFASSYPPNRTVEELTETTPEVKYNHNSENKIVTVQQDDPEPSCSKSKSILDIAAEISKAREKI